MTEHGDMPGDAEARAAAVAAEARQWAQLHEPTIDAAEDYAVDRERDRVVGL